MSKFHVDVQADASLPEGLESKLRKAVITTLQWENAQPDSAITILLTGDDHMQELNLTYRGLDKTTDVLSFPAGKPMPGMEELPLYLGDVAISVPYAGRQAASSGHSQQEELQLLAIHGVLHLLGYDHSDSSEKERMWLAQATLLSELNLSHVAPAEE